jgi:hypothetical protein
VGSLHSVVDAVDELSAGLSVVDAVLRAIVASPNLLFSLTWCLVGIVNGTSIAFQKICSTDCRVAAVVRRAGTVVAELLHDLCMDRLLESTTICLLAISQAYNDGCTKASSGDAQ